MHIVELDTFAAAHGALAWPWIALDPTHTRLAFVASAREIATRTLVADARLPAVTAGPSFALPEDLALPATDAEQGLRAFALSPEGTSLATIGTGSRSSLVVTLDASGEVKRSTLEELAALADGDQVARAVAFDRSGTRLWISAEGASESALLLVDARSHDVLGVLRGPVFPPPAVHELHVHPSDDAVLLLASCGEDGTFARVAGWSGGDPRSVALVPTALDGGDTPAGFVGFSADLAHVHLAEAEALRTHAWPGLAELASVPLDAEMVSSYSGVVLGQRILVDGAVEDDGEQETVMAFDRTGLRGSRIRPPFPEGMWVGRFGTDGLVTVEPKGDPATARVVRLPPPGN
jgi:hypothetical protein